MTATTPPSPVRPFRDALRLLLKALSVAVICAAVALAIVLLIPDENDYAEVTVLKHERLASLQAPRIVLVGGSNLAFGIDSALIAERTGTPVVNMGMNGYFGVRYMLEEVRPSLRAGDTVVIAFEYDNFFKSVEGSGWSLLALVKANPAALGYMNLDQQLSVLGAIPDVAQRKVLRILRNSAFGLRDDVFNGDEGPAIDSDTLISSIEVREGFNAEGDLTSHLGVDWPFERGPGIDLSLPIDPEVIDVIRTFNDEMSARGVRVIFSYTPLLRSFYQTHQASLNNLHPRILSAGLVAPSPPSAYVFDENLFFDTVYHLNAEGRALRSERLAQDINAVRSAQAQSQRSELTPTGVTYND